ncbi:hypothetical protein B0H17DRAFT_1131034 [Mycena rosella]|uniref:Uncharacterized protein n=1 Tax=Mycena rosella TaxID=1033263 RepID=A0AAD7GML3_MYCRO|nr:hypothetical protein B0H17DRAFT_1131034 [Mycena rosella]
MSHIHFIRATRQVRTGIFRASTAPWARSTGKMPTRLQAGPHPGDRAHHLRDDTATPAWHPPPALLRFESPAPAPALFRDDGRARRLLDGDIPTPARREDDPALQCPPPLDGVNRKYAPSRPTFPFAFTHPPNSAPCALALLRAHAGRRAHGRPAAPGAGTRGGGGKVE